MATENDNQAIPSNHIAAWFGWMTFFGMLGIVVTVCVQSYVAERCRQNVDRQSHAWMLDQADQLRRDEIDCLVNPDPEFHRRTAGRHCVCRKGPRSLSRKRSRRFASRKTSGIAKSEMR